MFLGSGFLAGKDEGKKGWQDGTLLDTSVRNIGKGDKSNIWAYKIDSAEYEYTAEAKSKKPFILEVPSPVKFEVKKDQLNLKSKDGKKHKLQVIKKAHMQPSVPPAQP